MHAIALGSAEALVARLGPPTVFCKHVMLRHLSGSSSKVLLRMTGLGLDTRGADPEFAKAASVVC